MTGVAGSTSGSGIPSVAGISKSPWLRTDRSERVKHALGVAVQEDAGLRVVGTYLGVQEFVTASRAEPPVMNDVRFVALPGFLADAGYAVEGAVQVGDSRKSVSLRPPEMRIIDVAPDRMEVVPEDGMLFLLGPDGRRCVLEVSTYGKDIKSRLFVTSGSAECFFDQWERYAAEHAYLRGQAFYASGEFVRIDPPLRLEDVYLPGETREMIQRTIVSFPEQLRQYRRHGLCGKRGVILEGPPGTGKTMLCRALCAELRGATFIWVTTRHVEKDSETIALVWRLARMLRPTIILLEDFDFFAESREDGWRSYLLGELMNQMDGVEASEGVLTLATTNRLEVIEKALRNRPGRFDRCIHFGELDENGRLELLRRHRITHLLRDDLCNRLLRETEGFTGARMVDLVKTLVDLAGENRLPQDEPRLTITEATIDQALREVNHVRRPQPIGFHAEDQRTVVKRR